MASSLNAHGWARKCRGKEPLKGTRSGTMPVGRLEKWGGGVVAVFKGGEGVGGGLVGGGGGGREGLLFYIQGC